MVPLPRWVGDEARPGLGLGQEMAVGSDCPSSPIFIPQTSTEHPLQAPTLLGPQGLENLQVVPALHPHKPSGGKRPGAFTAHCLISLLETPPLAYAEVCLSHPSPLCFPVPHPLSEGQASGRQTGPLHSPGEANSLHQRNLQIICRVREDQEAF